MMMMTTNVSTVSASSASTSASRVTSGRNWVSIGISVHLTKAVDEVRQDSRENGRRRQDEEVVKSQQRAVDSLTHTFGGIHGGFSGGSQHCG